MSRGAVTRDPWDDDPGPPEPREPLPAVPDDAPPATLAPAGDAHPRGDDPIVDLDAERAVLGAVLIAPAAIAEVATMLRPGDFYRPAHEAIYTAMLALDARGQKPDPVTVAAQLHHAGELKRVGGAPYLHTLAHGVPTAANIGHYAQIVRGRAVLRRLNTAATSITQDTHGPATPEEVLARAEKLIRDIATDAPTQPRARRIGDGLDELLDTLEQRPTTVDGIHWPWTDLNVTVHPLAPGQLVIIGARPSVGKSTFAVDVARHAAVQLRETVVIHTLEMARDEVEQRVLAAQARVDLRRIRGHALDDGDWERIAKANSRLADAPLIIDDTPSVTIAELRRSVRQHRPALLVLDYLQLARPTPTSRNTTRREALEEFTRDLKLLAKAEHIPIMAAAQLNRESEKRHDRRPIMADLRETGGVENDADIVLLLHREDVHDKTTRAGEIDVIVAKQRNGPTGTVTLGAQLHYARLADLSRWA